MSWLSGDNPWFGIRDGDWRARALLNRHYSAIRYKDGRRRLKVMGPGEYQLLMTPDSLAVFGWVKNTVDRLDNQEGLYNCLFRNEGPYLSSNLIKHAESLAHERWPTETRVFTYIDTEKVQSRNPGYCYLMAGWSKTGYSRSGKLLMEKVIA